MNKTLYLIPAGISQDYKLTAYPAELIGRLRVVFAEDIRTARRYFRSTGYEGSLDQQHWVTMQSDTPLDEIMMALNKITPENPGGVISEAGIPGVADPGAEVAAMAHELGIKVVPLPGASSIFMALAASGLNGQEFTFHGYLPIPEKEREKQLRMIENLARQSNYTQIFMETPYRNMQLLKSILKVCRDDTRLCIAADITGQKELILTQRISAWKSSRDNFHKLPAIFLLNT
ncbi:MAG: SAM-dependent methyltransferase [Bacteroidales bacterium]